MPSSVYTFSVTKFLPGEEINTFASVIFNLPPQRASDGSRIRFASLTALADNYSEISDPANQTLLRRFCVAHEQQHQNHPDEGNQARDDHERVEQMRSRRNTSIGKMARQFENGNRAECG